MPQQQSTQLSSQPDAAGSLNCLTFCSEVVPTDEATPQRLLMEHCRQLNSSLAALPDVELAKGQAIDQRVSEEQQNRVSSYYAEAQLELLHAVERRQTEERVKVLFGPTSRVVDHVLKGDAIALLVKRLCDEGKKDDLLKAIAAGPGTGELTFEPPNSSMELVANLLRWAAVRGADKKRFRASDPIRTWIAETMREADYDTDARLGGVSAVGAALADVLGRAPTMISLGKLPADLKDLLNPKMRVIGSDALAREASQLPLDESQVGNFCISGRKQPLQLPKDFESVMIDGKEYRTSELGCVDVIVSGASAVPGFTGLSQERLADAGRGHKLMVLTGTKELVDLEKISSFLDAVETMHEQGMSVALLYTETKNTAIEPVIWREIRERRCVEFFALNTSEAFDVLKRILDNSIADNVLGLSKEDQERVKDAFALGEAETPQWGRGRENPAWIFHSAALLQEFLQIPIVRVRGHDADVSITSAKVQGFSAPQVRNNLIVSRHNGTLKTANITGLIDQKGELGFLHNVPSGDTLAALHVIADAAKCPGFAHLCYGKLEDGRTCFAAAPIHFYDKSGGTQSAGDTIDVTFVTEEAEGLMAQAHASQR